MSPYRIVLLIAAGLLVSTSGMALELKDITYRTDNAGAVTFSHDTHLKKKRTTGEAFNCAACHQTGKGKRSHATMADMEKGKSCGACHNGTRAFSVAKCTGCHKVREVALQTPSTGTVQFSHRRHAATHPCTDCHARFFTTGNSPHASMAQMEKGASCGGCHNGKVAFGVDKCTRCHPVREIRYSLAGAGKVTFSHQRHLATIRCEGCHTRLFTPGSGNKKQTMAGMTKGRSCGGCHNGRIAFSVRENCAACHRVERITQTAGRN